jgi:glycosyltransferase involved in cell wall biosynthesis
LWHGKRIVRIYNGVDTKTFQPVPADRKQALRRKFGLPEDSLVVLLAGQTLGGFSEGIATEGFEALNRLADPRVVPLLVGPAAAEASKYLNGPSVTVDFRAAPEEMAECYQAADVTLVTSKVEAFGRIAAESQACATPVVSFDSGGLAEVVLDEIGGLSVRQGDVSGLTLALGRMVSQPELRARCGLLGRKFVEERFEESLITQQHVTLYRDVMAAGRDTSAR